MGLEGLGVTCQGACMSSCDREEASGDFTRRSGTRRFASCKEAPGDIRGQGEGSEWGGRGLREDRLLKAPLKSPGDERCQG